MAALLHASKIRDVDDAVIDTFSRGHGGSEDGSLTLVVASSTLKQLEKFSYS
jgi:hypothetical protein